MILNLIKYKVSNESLVKVNVPIIIASDVVFDASVIPALVNMLVTLMDDDMQCYLVSTIRNEETYRYFKENLSK